MKNMAIVKRRILVTTSILHRSVMMTNVILKPAIQGILCPADFTILEFANITYQKTQ